MDDDDPEVVVDATPDPKDNRTAIAVLQAKMHMVIYELRHSYVRKEDFAPLRLLLYGCVGVILSSVLVAIVSYVLHKGGTP